MLTRISTLALCLAASTSMAFAQGAVLQDKVGTVLVNGGAGFAPAKEGAALTPTDIVTVKRHSTAFLVYADGCRTKLTPGRAVTVGSTACSGKRELADLPSRAPPPVAPLAAPGFAFGPGAALGGVILAGAGIGAGIALANRNDPFFPNNGGGGGRGMSPQ